MIAARDNHRFFTPETYFAWEAQQLGKHELIDGHVYAMSGGTQTHSTIAINCLLLIRGHLRGSQCRVFNSDLKVNILHTLNYTYPDLSVTCDDRDRENALYITYPCLIVEVLSESTEAYDRGKKFDKYRRNPQLIDYVLVSSDTMAIDIYHKNEAADWVILSFRPGDQVELKSIGLTAAIERFYETVNFD
ncbi:MAG: Uma2 family endonuclease [Synechocystis sp.]|jgi:Uma2 family endonuclease